MRITSGLFKGVTLRIWGGCVNLRDHTCTRSGLAANFQRRPDSPCNYHALASSIVGRFAWVDGDTHHDWFSRSHIAQSRPDARMAFLTGLMKGAALEDESQNACSANPTISRSYLPCRPPPTRSVRRSGGFVQTAFKGIAPR
jgi:hypothetical protein